MVDDLKPTNIADMISLKVDDVSPKTSDVSYGR